MLSRRSLIRIWLPVGFVGVTLALGLLVNSQSLLLVAFFGLMMIMHLFGHGGHGGGHSHGDSEEEERDGSG